LDPSRVRKGDFAGLGEVRLVSFHAELISLLISLLVSLKLIPFLEETIYQYNITFPEAFLLCCVNKKYDLTPVK